MSGGSRRSWVRRSDRSRQSKSTLGRVEGSDRLARRAGLPEVTTMMHVKRSSRAVLMTVAVLLLSPAFSTPAQAAPPSTPNALAPTPGQVVTANPTFSWSTPASTNLLNYEFQVSTNGTFSIITYSVTTHNTSVTPPNDLPIGNLFWRVRARDTITAELSPYTAAQPFTKDPPAAPNVTSPADGSTHAFPDDPIELAWDPMSGIKNFEVQIDLDPAFTPPIQASYTTNNNTLHVPFPQIVGQTYYWHVRGMGPTGLATQWSANRTYFMSWPDGEPTPTYPPNELAFPLSPAIEEVVLRWDPVRGAESYVLEVSSDINFGPGTIVDSKTILSTRYSPETSYLADTYYWHVRSRNNQGNLSAWSQTQQFTRAWPAPAGGAGGPGGGTLTDYQTLTLLTPPPDSFNNPMPDFTWTPVRLASTYRFQMSPDVNFSFGVSQCIVRHARLLVGPDCPIPTIATVYYWRVQAIDNNSGALTPFSASRRFQYVPASIILTGPADGATTDLPVLTWDTVDDIGKYRVTIVNQGTGALVQTVDTYNTSLIPTGLPVPPPGGTIYDWYVRPLTHNGGVGPIPSGSSWRTFTLIPPVSPTGTPTLLTPPLTGGDHAPPLTWTHVTNALTYDIWYAPQGSGIYFPLPDADGLTLPGFANKQANLGAGTYEYWVEAFNNVGVLIATSSLSTFVVTTLAGTTGTAPANCPPLTVCTVQADTPEIAWTRVPGASHYLLTLSRDKDFTNTIETVLVPNWNRYLSQDLYPDSQAGQATYWYARPCYGAVCGTEPGSFGGTFPPIMAFRKQSREVKLLSPLNGVKVPNQITFTWEDFLRTNMLAAPAVPKSAANYKIEISTAADFTAIIDTATVDQTTYTSYNMTYPEGPLYWRVRAIDASGNQLPASEQDVVPASRTGKVVKESPKVTLLTPTDGQVLGILPTFSWESLDYAVTYEWEVYKNPGQPISPGNKISSTPGTTEVTSLTPYGSLVAGQLYGWRVRPIDTSGRPGPWTTYDPITQTDSNTRFWTFFYQGPVATPISPTPDGIDLPDNNITLTWQPVGGATQYRVDISTSPTFTGGNFETANTVMTSFATTANYTLGRYYWRVTTLDANGVAMGTSVTRFFDRGPVEPDPVYFYSLPPARILDSRPSSQVGPYGTKWGAGVERAVEVTNRGGVPGTAKAVALNVTVVNTSAPSFLTIWPNGLPRPNVSSINWTAGQVIPNAVTVKVGTVGSIAVFNPSGTVDVIIDVVGYYDDAAGAGYTSLTPTRIIDSRPPTEQVGPYGTPWGPGMTRPVTVTGGSVPADADSVVMNVTVTGGTQGSHLTIWPFGTAIPVASSLNFSAGQTIPNAVTVKVGGSGQINVFNNSGNVNVIIDIVGYFKVGTGAPFHPLDPFRVLDSRPGEPAPDAYTTPWTAGLTRDVTIVGGTPVGGAAEAVMLNVTVTGTSAPSFLTVFPADATKPTASSLNWGAGTTIANSVTGKLGQLTTNKGKVKMFNNSGTVHVIADVNGYYG